MPVKAVSLLISQHSPTVSERIDGGPYEKAAVVAKIRYRSTRNSQHDGPEFCLGS